MRSRQHTKRLSRMRRKAIPLVLSEFELHVLNAAVEASGLTRADFIRDAAMIRAVRTLKLPRTAEFINLPH